MKKLATLTGSLLLAMSLVSVASAQSNQTPVQPFGSGFDPSNQMANLNTLIQRVNAILTPLQPTSQGGVNFLQLTPATTGYGPVIGIQPGGDASAPIRVAPSGNGDIILFPAQWSYASQGHIKVGNYNSWVTAGGFAACPGVLPGKAPLGTKDHITGFLVVKDWLDQLHGMPGC